MASPGNGIWDRDWVQLVYWGVPSVEELRSSERSSTMIQWLKTTATTSAIPTGSFGAGWGWMALQDRPKLGWAGQTFILWLPFNSCQFRVSHDSWRMASYSYWVSFPPAGPSFSDFFGLNLLILLFPGSWPTNQAFITVYGSTDILTSDTFLSTQSG